MLPSGRIISDEVHRGLEAGLGRKVDFFVEFLDALRFPEPVSGDMVGKLLDAKYYEERFDLIFALGPQAYQLIAERREVGYFSAPVIYLGMRASTIERLPALPDATGIISRFDLLETVRLAEMLQPGLKDVFVVTGSSAFDRSWEETARRELAGFSGDLTITFLASLSLDTVMERIAALPGRPALLYLTMFEGPDGASYMAPEVAERLSTVAPVYSVYSTYLDHGVVGGYMDTFESVGSAGAKLGLRILAGEEAVAIPAAPVEPQTYVVNWPALQHWGLDPARLPEDTIVRGRTPSVWDEYRDQILVFATLLVLQTLLILALLAQGRRRRLAESRLLESEDRMRLAASSANLGLWRWDSDRNKVWMTDHCRNILGFSADAETTIGLLLAKVHREDRAALQRQIEQSARWESPFDTECRIVLPDRTVRWLSIKGQSTRRSSDPADQVTGVVLDISERKAEQLEAEQQRNQLTHLTRVAILGELSGAMAHELNQPLAAILSNAQAAQRLLELDPPDLDETRAIMTDIVSDNLRAGEVIQRLRSLLKRGETNPERLDLSKLTSDVLELARSELVTQRVLLQTDLDPDLPVVVGDRVQLQQVLLNLIVNACEAMREMPTSGRVLYVSSRESTGREVEICIADRGPGIAGEIADQIFEPFATTKKEGLGLGLSISRTIIQSHNGHLTVADCSDGGAAFRIRLPSEG